MSHARLLPVLAIVLITALMISCAPAPAAPPAPSATSAEEATMAPPPTEEAMAEAEPGAVDRSNTLIIAAPGDLEGWDPATSTYYTVNDMIQTSYDTLVEYDVTEDDQGRPVADTTKIIGSLAESFEVSDDGLTWTFNLRDGATFHSGNPVTSADVVYSFARGLEMERGILYTMLGFAGITSPDQMIADDPGVFQVQLEEPNNLLLHILSLKSNSAILDSQVVEEHTTSDDPYAEQWLRNHEAGSGPYVLDRYEPGNQAIYSAFEDYWGGAPDLKRVIYRTVPSPQDRILLLLSGDVDIVYDVPGQDLTTTLQDEPNVQVLSYPAPSTTVFFVDNTLEPFTDVRVRKALCYAVPYDALIERVLYGLGSQSPGPVAPGVAFSEDVNECTYDPEQTQALLDEAGLSDGFDMTLTYREGRPEEEGAAVFLQAELAKYNINVELEKIQSAAWNERRSAKTIEAGLDGYTPYAPDPIYVMNFWYTTDAVLNTWQYSNERVDELTNLTKVESDKATIGEYMTEAQEIIGEDQPVVWLFNPNWNLVMRDNVHGYVFFPDRFTRHARLTKD